MYLSNRILIVFVLVFILVVRTDAQFFDSEHEEDLDEYTTAMKVSPTIIPPTKIKSSKNKSESLSPILNALSYKHTSTRGVNKTKSSIFFTNQSTLFPLASTSRKTPPTTTAFLTPYMLVSYLVEEFNHYRNIDILSRIKRCDSNLKLNDVCETYSFDNHTYSLIREPNVEFQSLQHLYDALVDRITVQKLSQFCLTGHWCLGNLTKDDIHFTIDVLRQRGRSFCSLELCHHRLAVYTTTCPSLSEKNISIPTLKLLPMLCALYQEQQSRDSTQCNEQIVYLIHILYAYWPQLETCYHVIAAGSGGCTPECQAFDDLLHTVENQCSKNASFLTRVPTLAWYRLINLKEICRHETIPMKPAFISSIKNFISSNMLWYRFNQRPFYAALFIIVVICIVISFSLCLYLMSKNDYDSNTRHLDDNYEYTRLHDSTFELGSNTEIPNTNSTSSRMINESHIDSNGNLRPSEQQRLLYMES